MEQTAGYWIEKLNLQSHPEGGYFAETYRSEEIIPSDFLPERYIGERNFGTAIYFLLKGNQHSSFHKLKSDEVWHFYTGSGLTLYVIDFEGYLHQNILGPEFEKGEQFQITVSANQWFAAKVNDPNRFSLVGCTLAPGFDFNDFELADRSQLVKQYPQHRSLINSLT